MDAISQRYSLFRGLRAIRKTLDDDGLIGRVTGSTAYLTIGDVRYLWVVLVLLLRVVDDFLELYLVIDPLDRHMREHFNDPSPYRLLGQALRSNLLLQLNRVLLIWWLLDTALGLCFQILDKYAVEPHETAEREYKKDLRELGELDEDEVENSSRLAPLVGTKAFRYLSRAVIGWMVITMTMDAGIGAYDSVQTASDTMPAATTADLARFNPHRDLLPTQDRVLRDLIYIKHVLGDLIPTTLPEDDYQLYSDLLRSLEARTDISWRVYEETNIGKTIMAAANRRGPIANEPFFIGDRIKALHKHWHALELTSDRPERWESASDTMFLNPIIQGRALGGGGKHLDAAQQTSMSDSASGHFKLTLSPEQEVEATSIYTKWRRKRDHRVSYLKLHPPQPVAWVPVSRSDVGARNAWGTLFDDGTVSAGRRVSYSRLVGNKEWKPIFSSMDWAYVPHDWAAPGEQAPTDEDLKKDIEALIAEGDKKAERNTKQVLYQQELKAQLRQQEEKREL